MNLPNIRQVDINTGWIKVSLVPNESEKNAAWELYVELVTRISSKDFDVNSGSLRAAMESLHVIFVQTRSVLRSAGPSVAHSENSFGSIAIYFLKEVLGPFLLKWHEKLRAYEHSRCDSVPHISHEQNWEHHKDFCDDLDTLNANTSEYITALADIAGVTHGITRQSR